LVTNKKEAANRGALGRQVHWTEHSRRRLLVLRRRRKGLDMTQNESRDMKSIVMASVILAAIIPGGAITGLRG
jgi:hypothetical protein